MKILQLLFGFTAPVNRRVYASVGFSLMAFKYAVEAGIFWFAKGLMYSPLDFFSPLASKFFPGDKLMSYPAVAMAWALWALPFLWVGVSMSIRRAENAGRSPWWGALFFVPVLNLAVMLGLAVLPEQPESESKAPSARGSIFFAGPFWALAAVSALGSFSILLSVNYLQSYGVGLFAGTPFVAGLVGSYLLNRRNTLTDRQTIFAALAGIGAVFGIFLVTAIEGIFCLAMAAPVSVVIAVPAALLGRQLALREKGARLYSLLPLFLAIPAFAAFDVLNAERPRFEVLTSVDIAAPPETVWKNVVTFPELAPPTDWLFRGGIAYPIRARIEGQGVGAIRYCEFSTGPFVEPITAWEEPTRLAFSVTSSPRPMNEFNPFGTVEAPHLNGGYMESEQGEFRLVRLPGGGTRLEGRTWYTQGLFPQVYWRFFSDAIIHKIHLRVLEHIKRLSES